MNERLGTRSIVSQPIGSVATNASTNLPLAQLPFAHAVVGATIVNSAANAVTSGTTTGSAASVNVYITASNSGSKVATFNGSGTTIATQATQAMVLSTSTALLRAGTAGAVYHFEVVGGAANNASNAGLVVMLHYVMGNQDGATPAAGTGPA